MLVSQIAVPFLSGVSPMFEYDVTADSYVVNKRKHADEVEAHAINDAINEFREWEAAKSPAKLLREWAKKGQPAT